jgi:putative membrane protein
MGCAEVVPGISGGTVALIVGVYDRLLLSIRAAFASAAAAIRLDLQQARAHLREVHWTLVLPLMAGMAVALLVGAAVIPPLLERHPEESSALFFGLILASLVVPWRMWQRRRAHHVAVAAVAALLAFLMTGLPERDVADPSRLAVFVAAAFAICALTLPGVSGSYLLLALGLYAPTLEAVDARDLGYLAVFAAGALVGLGLFARILVKLLRDHRDITVAALLGLMVGSLRALWPWSAADGALLAPPSEASTVLPVALMALCGIAAVLTLLSVQRHLDAPAGG